MSLLTLSGPKSSCVSDVHLRLANDAGVPSQQKTSRGSRMNLARMSSKVASELGMVTDCLQTCSGREGRPQGGDVCSFRESRDQLLRGNERRRGVEHGRRVGHGR